MSPKPRENLSSVAAQFEESPRRGNRRGVTPELKSRILSRVTSGQRIADVAKACGVHPKSIYQWRSELRKELSMQPEFRKISVARPEFSRAKSIITKAKITIASDLSLEIETEDLVGLIRMLRGAV
jgi:transposase-like protein